MELKTRALTECFHLNEEVAYKFYLIYIKANNIRQVLYRCDYEGINALFDNPADAVYEFLNNGITSLDHWKFIYLNSASDLQFSDDIDDVINMTEFTDWLLNKVNEEDFKELCEWLDDADFHWYYAQQLLCGSSTYTMMGVSAWLEENKINSDVLLKSDNEEIRELYNKTIRA